MWGADFVDIIILLGLKQAAEEKRIGYWTKWDIFNLLLEGSSWENNNKNGMDFLKN